MHTLADDGIVKLVLLGLLARSTRARAARSVLLANHLGLEPAAEERGDDAGLFGLGLLLGGHLDCLAGNDRVRVERASGLVGARIRAGAAVVELAVVRLAPEARATDMAVVGRLVNCLVS